MRRLWTLTVQPLANRIAEELARVLERPVTLSHGVPAGTADVAARARSVKALVDAGVGHEARRMGLMMPCNGPADRLKRPGSARLPTCGA